MRLAFLKSQRRHITTRFLCHHFFSSHAPSWYMAVLGLETEFSSEIIPGKRSERFPLFRGKKCSFRGIPRFTEESIPKLGIERNYLKKISFAKNHAPAKCFGTEFWEFAPIFVPWNGFPSCFLFRGMVRNEIPSCFLIFLFHRRELRVVFSSAE